MAVASCPLAVRPREASYSSFCLGRDCSQVPPRPPRFCEATSQVPPLALGPGAPQPSRWLSSRPSPVCPPSSWTGGPGLETVLQHRPRKQLSGGRRRLPDCHGPQTPPSFQLPLLWLGKTPEQQSCQPA